MKKKLSDLSEKDLSEEEKEDIRKKLSKIVLLMIFFIGIILAIIDISSKGIIMDVYKSGGSIKDIIMAFAINVLGAFVMTLPVTIPFKIAKII